MKVSELAKELGLSSKDLIAQAKENNIKIKSAVSAVDDETAAKLRTVLGKKTASAKPVEKTAHLKKEKKPRAKPKTKAKTTEAPAPVVKNEIAAKQEIEEAKKTVVSLIDKPAHTEKEVRALRPHELEEKEIEETGKEKRRLKLFTKSSTFKQAILEGKTTVFQSGSALPSIKKPVVPVKKTPERKIVVSLPVTVREISEKIGVKANQLIGKLMNHKIMLNVNDSLSEDALILIGLELNYEIEIRKEKDVFKDVVKIEDEKAENLVARPPVVVIMGHVDHGKTTLLDKIRSADVAAHEAGEITQHLGAYQTTVNNRKITFLDTPGHEAFTNMRARGANVTDIAVLVVAADDGVMPQTEEAISHLKAAKVPVIVAINKIDKKEANLIKVKQQLASAELISEEWGGKTIFAEVSAVTGQGVKELLEMLLLQADMLELKANPKRKAVGTVLESRLTENYGPWATVLIQNGTLHKGDAVLCGATYGKIRSLYDDKLNQISEASPATPVGITGLEALPEVGDKLYAMEDVKTAKEKAEEIQEERKLSKAVPAKHLTMENLFSQLEAGKTKEFRIILKTDVKGSLEVLNNLLSTLSNDEVKISVIHSGVGGITESDILLADASDAIVVGFNIIADDKNKALAQDRGVQLKSYDIIYHLIEDMKLALEGMLKPEKVEVVTAHLTVRSLFKISRFGTIAGCMVADGKIERSNLVRLKRGGQILFEGKIDSLKRFKDDVREVAQGYECGVKLAGFDDIQVGDVIESYRIEEKSRKL
ncbi:MAG: translation initiation factor IF-2 [Planctomycetes bacterium]|nr:translation initiation factor IF-2 [Planctomycetota bacterium]